MSAQGQQLRATTVTPPTSVVVEDEPSFTELVYAHYAWWRKRHNGKAADAEPPTATSCIASSNTTDAWSTRSGARTWKAGSP